jgi:hypothetical protein
VQLPIVFIGPPAAGKSTLASRLAADLGLPHTPLDLVRFYYFLRQPTFRLADQMAQPDFAHVVRYWKPFEIEAAERVLADFADAVIDFGAGQAHYTDPGRRARLRRALQPLPNVFLLLPSADLDRAERVCNERDQRRLGADYDPSRATLVRDFVRSESFREVASHTVITGEGASVDDALARVKQLLR